MKIPKRFKLFGATVNVVFDANIHNEHDSVGRVSFRRNLIRLLPDSPTIPRPQELIEQTFCHELVHLIFFSASFKIGDKYAHDNEDVVELVANLLHQALVTAEYEEDSI